VFIGLGEITTTTSDALLRFFDAPDVPSGIESTLEEAYLAQPPPPERKTLTEAFFKELLQFGDIDEALALLVLAQHNQDWKRVNNILKQQQNPLADHPELFLTARDIVG
jgi:hypothetical protein